MKEIFISDLQSIPEGQSVTLYGWLKSHRIHSHVAFLDVCDSSGFIQAVIEDSNAEAFALAKKISIESAICIAGKVFQSAKGAREVLAEEVHVIAEARHKLAPRLRSEIDIFDVSNADDLLSNRHLYIRNEKAMAILKFRQIVMSALHNWFQHNRFTEISAPVLTALPLYDDGSAISVTIHDEDLFLTQCVGFYLESAVHAFERVYNMGPSFRGEESRSKRHLMEYWHVKAEVAFCDLDDMIGIVEAIVSGMVSLTRNQGVEICSILNTKLCDEVTLPFPRITYRDAVAQLGINGIEFAFGRSLGQDEEEFLAREFSGPFWVTGIPRNIEPFPYKIDADDPEITRTADLILPDGYGELLGVAEKITDSDMLDERMQEKGKLNLPQYEWLRELRQAGCVPHSAFGMGLERLIRWLLYIPHVRDAIPFPRTFRRKVYP